MDRSSHFNRFKHGNRRNIFMMILIIVFALIMLVLLLQLNASSNLKKYRVLVNQRPLTRGSQIIQDNLTWKTYSKDQIKPDYFTQDQTSANDLVGAIAMRDIPAGEALTRNNVLMPSSSPNYQQLVQPNMRAVMEPIRNLGYGFVRPGAYVDILVTYDATSLRSPNAQRGVQPAIAPANLVTRTLLKNVLVLGVYPNQVLTSAPATRTSGLGLFSGDNRDENSYWLTFELYPKQVEMITAANEMGKVSISLQGRVVGEIMEGNSFTTGRDIAHINPPYQVTIIRGTGKEVLYFER